MAANRQPDAAVLRQPALGNVDRGWIEAMKKRESRIPTLVS
jgi:mannitol/fructose-specific phosphotransferase system IIA component